MEEMHEIEKDLRRFEVVTAFIAILIERACEWNSTGISWPFCFFVKMFFFCLFAMHQVFDDRKWNEKNLKKIWYYNELFRTNRGCTEWKMHLTNIKWNLIWNMICRFALRLKKLFLGLWVFVVAIRVDRIIFNFDKFVIYEVCVEMFCWRHRTKGIRIIHT